MSTVPVKTITDEVPDEQTALAPQRKHDRDADQVTIDGWTKEKVAEWEAAGKPTSETDDSGNVTYSGPTKRFATDDSPDAKRRVARAFALINRDRQAGDKLAALWYRNSKPDGDGFVTVKFGVRIMPPKEAAATNTNGETEQPSEPEQPKPEQPGEPEQPKPEQPSEPEQPESGRGFRRGR